MNSSWRRFRPKNKYWHRLRLRRIRLKFNALNW